jgi:alpha-mannosidase
MTRAADPRPILYLVSNCHLDTQWRWTVRDTIAEHLPATLARTFELFERLPAFVLSFEGAFRYQLLEEYWPDGFRQVQEFARAGRWHAAGCMLDAPDVNIPSPESLLRHMLYGARYFDRVLGRHGADVFLPDCFGFGAALPTIGAHCGLIGFGTSKLVRWKSPGTIPFDLGRWQGIDGSELIAVLHPEGYGEGLAEDLSRAERWIDRIEGRIAARPGDGLRVACMFVGPKGDKGGGLDDASIEWLERSLAGDGPIEVRLVASDQLFRDLTTAERAALPEFRGELLLPTHGTGCWTSQALVKRWNRRCELLADAAERAAAVADWLGGLPYPHREIEAAWTAFLWHQMHDDLTGTSRQEAYLHTWNDQAASLNRFASVLTDAVGTVARALDTRVEGMPLVVFNPLAAAREDVVVARIETPEGSLRVFDPEGREVPSQVRNKAAGGAELVFVARLPPFGFAVFDVRPASSGCEIETGLEVASSALSSRHLGASLDAAGDLATLSLQEEPRNLLASPAGLELLPDRSSRWPAWEVLWRDVTSPALGRFGAPARVEILERGPARVALAVTRRCGRSTVRQVLSLAAGEAGARLEVDCRFDWWSRGRLLKATFPTAFEDPVATYDLGVGAIEREVNHPEAYEVPAQQWADLSQRSGRAGLSILNDCRYGWDRPEEATLRLSLLRSPRVGRRFRHQATQDHGRHRLRYALFPHAGGWAAAAAWEQAARHNQPLVAFRVEPSAGALGRTFSLFPEVSRARLHGVKKAEEGERIVVRLSEPSGEGGPARLTACGPLAAAASINGLEEASDAVALAGATLEARLAPFELRSYAIELPPPPARLEPPRVLPLSLPLDRAAASWHTAARGIDFDGSGRSYPGELLPAALLVAGAPLPLAASEPGTPHCLAASGQELPWPGAPYDYLLLVVTAVRGAASGALEAGGERLSLAAPDWAAPIGRGVYRRYLRGLPIGGAKPPLLERHPLAWVGGHRHDRRLRDEPYTPCYLFRSVLRIPAGTTTLRLPHEPRLRLFAAAAVAGSGLGVEAVSELYGW